MPTAVYDSGVYDTDLYGSGTASPQTIVVNGVGSSEAVGLPLVLLEHILIAVGFDDEHVGTPTLTIENVIYASGIASGEAVGLPTVLAEHIVTAIGINDELVGTPLLGSGGTIIASGFDDEAVGTPTVSNATLGPIDKTFITATFKPRIISQGTP